MAPNHALRGEKLSWCDEQIHAVTLDKKSRKGWTSRITAVSDQVAMRVFGIPELMEMIMLNLDPLEIFRTMQTVTAMRDCVNYSPRLKQHIGLISPKLSTAADFSPTLYVKDGGSWLDDDHYDHPSRFRLYSKIRPGLSIGGFLFATFDQTYSANYATWGNLGQFVPGTVDPRCLKTAHFCITAHLDLTVDSMGERLKQLSPVSKRVIVMDVLVDSLRKLWVHFLGRARLNDDDPIMVKRQQRWAASKYYQFPVEFWAEKSDAYDAEENDWEEDEYLDWYEEQFGEEDEAEAGEEEEAVVGEEQPSADK
ncbi:hypothetical protein Slin15195_G037120 [Septoria linicola]|uniref:F-box domain-containing protein n=1 Tax=Septoria linicola TaxID=215465 RepID=A0A9Q9ANU2_9PEZI|nr:hypothetical protein Slin15195_G037120 [Septoria linicola]